MNNENTTYQLRLMIYKDNKTGILEEEHSIILDEFQNKEWAIKMAEQIAKDY
jgi:hypothetical protein